MSRAREPGEDDAPLGCDLSRFDDEYAAAPRTARAPIPDGPYVVQVVKAELTTTRRAGHPMLRWTLRLCEPPFAGRLFWRNSVLVSAPNLRWLKSDLWVCGIELGRLSDLPDELWRLEGLELEVTKRSQGDRETIYLNRRREPGGDAARHAR